MAQMTLVIGNYNYSSWSFRAWLALVKANLPFEVVRIPIHTADSREQILKLSPTGKVPALRDGEVNVWDSLAIAEYVVEKAPSLWPQDVAARAYARSISAEMHSGFMAVRSAMPMNCRATGRNVAMTDAIAADIRRIEQIIQDCRSHYAEQGPWLFGEFSIADAMYIPVMSRFVTYGVACSEPVLAYINTIKNDAQIAEWFKAAQAEIEVIASSEVGV